MPTTTNKRFGHKVNPYEFTPSHIKGLERMARWYKEVEGNTIFEINFGLGAPMDTLSYSGESWGEYITNYIERDSYGDVAKVVLNELRSIYIEHMEEIRRLSPI